MADPNQPNPQPQQQTQMSVLDLPTMEGPLTGAARAAAAQRVYGVPAPAPAPTYQSPGRAPAIPLPSYDPSAPSLVGHANTPGVAQVDPQASGFSQWGQGAQATQDFNARAGKLAAANTPGPLAHVNNWLFGAGAAKDQFAQQSFAGDTYSRPEAKSYFSAHPSLLAAAESDPVGFAIKLGPILDAHVAAQNGTVQPGTITIQTPDGPMVKHDPNPPLTQSMAEAHGTHIQGAHAMLNPHAYNDQEWLAATAGMSRRAMKNIWQMQQHLSPQEKAQALLLGGAEQGAQGADPKSAAAIQLDIAPASVMPSSRIWPLTSSL